LDFLGKVQNFLNFSERVEEKLGQIGKKYKNHDKEIRKFQKNFQLFQENPNDYPFDGILRMIFLRFLGHETLKDF